MNSMAYKPRPNTLAADYSVRAAPNIAASFLRVRRPLTLSPVIEVGRSSIAWVASCETPSSHAKTPPQPFCQLISTSTSFTRTRLAISA